MFELSGKKPPEEPRNWFARFGVGWIGATYILGFLIVLGAFAGSGYCLWTVRPQPQQASARHENEFGLFWRQIPSTAAAKDGEGKR